MVVGRSSDDWITLMLASFILNLFKSLYLLIFIYLFLHHKTVIVLDFAKSTDHKQIVINLMKINCQFDCVRLHSSVWSWREAAVLLQNIFPGGVLRLLATQ